MGSSSGHKHTLGAHIVTSPNDNFILGILLPFSDEKSLNLAFLNNEIQSEDRLSYFFCYDYFGNHQRANVPRQSPRPTGHCTVR